MKNAKTGYLLENGLLLSGTERVKITANDGEVNTGYITDISDKGIDIQLEDEIGQWCLFFEEITDVEIVE